jgi:hypothetical protein
VSPSCYEYGISFMETLAVVAYRPVARQRPRNKQRVLPLLCSRRINKRPFLSNGSVSTLPQKRDAHNNIVTVETGVFSMWPVPRS